MTINSINLMENQSIPALGSGPDELGQNVMIYFKFGQRSKNAAPDLNALTESPR